MGEWTRLLRFVSLLVVISILVSNEHSVEAKALCSHRCDQHFQSANMLTCSYSRTKEDFFDIRLKSCGLQWSVTKKKRFAFGYLNLENEFPADFFSQFGNETDDIQITYTNMPTFPFPEIQTLQAPLANLGLEYNGITDWDLSNAKNLIFATTLLRIYLDGNSFSYLPDGAFDIFTNLKTINLPKNKLTYISSKTFGAALSALTTLVLRDNNIMYIDVGAFDKLPLLKLDLSGNKLAALAPDTFNAVFNKLTDLRLGGNPFFGYKFNTWLFTKIYAREDAAELLTYSNATCTRPVAGDFKTIFSATTVAGDATVTIKTFNLTVVDNQANAVIVLHK